MAQTARYVLLTGDDDNPTRPIAIEDLGDDRYNVTIDGKTHEITAYPTDRGVALLRGVRSRDVQVESRAPGEWIAHLPAGRVDLKLMEERLWRLRSVLGGAGGAGDDKLVSPMAGKVVLTSVQPGDSVEEGQTLVIVEAMKMENELRATAAGTVAAVHVAAGDTVEPGMVLVEFEVE